jgi:BirA family transcriptional regulator, biotin operon repressor / biotin---[acetyl-CoA-carboxylase] ligase
MNEPILGQIVIHLESVDSTNNYTHSLLQDQHIVAGTVILADYQSHGKGQAGNQWFSEKGSNLLFSFLLKPTFLLAEKQFYLSMCVSNGIVAYLNALIPGGAIKWPNDVYHNGKKLAGILIENTILGNRLNTAIVGVGININQKVFPPELNQATSLYLATGQEQDIGKQFSALLGLLNHHLEFLYNWRYAEIRNGYLNHLYLLNQWHVYNDLEGTFEGRITDILDSGELVVKQRSGIIKQYSFKEIQF